ncbi:basic salivary proline-rich protein 4-like [Falco naumanni]|uniref:basic salivary proline-rich protein 4-like n=1 Tax=Falco naumanni TaxID=148594 RepID=UPI001ADE96A1|nr:basic salivary proline-rich protein 4-like [Falco naumanni]
MPGAQGSQQYLSPRLPAGRRRRAPSAAAELPQPEERPGRRLQPAGQRTSFLPPGQATSSRRRRSSLTPPADTSDRPGRGGSPSPCPRPRGRPPARRPRGPPQRGALYLQTPFRARTPPPAPGAPLRRERRPQGPGAAPLGPQPPASRSAPLPAPRVRPARPVGARSAPLTPGPSPLRPGRRRRSAEGPGQPPAERSGAPRSAAAGPGGAATVRREGTKRLCAPGPGPRVRRPQTPLSPHPSPPPRRCTHGPSQAHRGLRCSHGRAPRPRHRLQPGARPPRRSCRCRSRRHVTRRGGQGGAVPAAAPPPRGGQGRAGPGGGPGARAEGQRRPAGPVATHRTERCRWLRRPPEPRERLNLSRGGWARARGGTPSRRALASQPRLPPRNAAVGSPCARGASRSLRAHLSQTRRRSGPSGARRGRCALPPSSARTGGLRAQTVGLQR